MPSKTRVRRARRFGGWSSQWRTLLPLAAALLTCSAAAASPHSGAPQQAAAAAPSQKLYAQELVDRTVANHPELLDVILHVTPPHTRRNMAIAAYTLKERNQASGEDDIGVMNSGRPIVEVQKDGARIGILLPLDDRSGRRIGAVGLMYAWQKGDSEQAFLARAAGVQAALQSQIASKEQLFQPR